jgi:hypothetical protein
MDTISVASVVKRGRKKEFMYSFTMSIYILKVQAYISLIVGRDPWMLSLRLIAIPGFVKISKRFFGVHVFVGPHRAWLLFCPSVRLLPESLFFFFFSTFAHYIYTLSPFCHSYIITGSILRTGTGEENDDYRTERPVTSFC